MDIKIKVTQHGFDKHFSIDEWFHFSELSNLDIYNKMILFVVDEEGNEVSLDNARKLFKEVPKSEWTEYVSQFIKSVSDAFVSPTNGGG